MSPVTECRTKLPLEELLTTAVVTITGYFYRVDFVNIDEIKGSLHKSTHRVSKEKRCSCYRGADCPAVSVVAAYLKEGGERAPDPPPGFSPVTPSSCPICGKDTIYDPSLDSRERGAGWRCIAAGSRHYWEAHVSVLKQNFAANPWHFPPVVMREGERVIAYDGVLEGDVVLYPGVLRSDLVSTNNSK
jgi:hypothetical protein